MEAIGDDVAPLYYYSLHFFTLTSVLPQGTSQMTKGATTTSWTQPKSNPLQNEHRQLEAASLIFSSYAQQDRDRTEERSIMIEDVGVRKPLPPSRRNGMSLE